MPGPCSLCDARCCKSYLITTTIFDVLRIMEHTALPVERFCRLHEPRLLGYDPDMVLDTTDGYGRYLLGLASHPCFFLSKDGLCSMHGYAPLSCRSFPFRADGKMSTRTCPLIPSLLMRIKGPDMPINHLLDELRRHKAIVRDWNRRPGTCKEALAFLLDGARASSGILRGRA